MSYEKRRRIKRKTNTTLTRVSVEGGREGERTGGACERGSLLFSILAFSLMFRIMACDKDNYVILCTVPAAGNASNNITLDIIKWRFEPSYGQTVTDGLKPTLL